MFVCEKMCQQTLEYLASGNYGTVFKVDLTDVTTNEKHSFAIKFFNLQKDFDENWYFFKKEVSKMPYLQYDQFAGILATYAGKDKSGHSRRFVDYVRIDIEYQANGIIKHTVFIFIIVSRNEFIEI